MAAPKGVYEIRSIINPNNVYIGSSENIYRRWKSHERYLKSNTHHSIILQNHVNKYGFNDLKFSILMECDVKDLIKNEQKFIDENNPKFNIRKIADSNRGIKRMDVTKNKLRLANLGKKLSDVTRDKMRQRMIGNKITKGLDVVNSKIILCIDNGVFYKSINEASISHGIKRTTLNAMLTGQNKNRTNLIYA